MNIPKKIILYLIDKQPKNLNELQIYLRKFCRQHKTAPVKKQTLISAYHKLLKKQIIKPDKKMEELLKKRAVRTLSGVAVIAVLTKPYPCPGKCIYCPSPVDMPKSYLDNEPAVMRAVLSKFDPFIQMKVRIKALQDNGHPTDKLEVIVMGGTWSCLPKNYQTWFIKRLFDGANSSQPFNYDKAVKMKGAKNLAEAQKKNQTAKHRIIGLTLETRPDFIDIKEVKRFRKLGCTKVELGVQTLDDQILKLVRRGHLIQQTIKATKLLKDAGFKIAYHMMPALPGSTPKKDVQMIKKLFTDQNFQPDMLKIYPTVITAESVIYNWHKQGKYKPYTDKQLFQALLKIKQAVPPYVRIIRLIRDIPEESIIAGNKISNLREMLQRELIRQNQPCQCIRCREARQKTVSLEQTKFIIRTYPASDGQEYFLSYESPDQKTIYAFLRLRMPSAIVKEAPDNQLWQSMPELNGAALIRELHTYGKLVSLGEKSKTGAQHQGFGKALMAQAEKITKQLGIKKIAVISGIGVRQYYKKLGYKLEASYMTKRLA